MSLLQVTASMPRLRFAGARRSDSAGAGGKQAAPRGPPSTLHPYSPLGGVRHCKCCGSGRSLLRFGLWGSASAVDFCRSPFVPKGRKGPRRSLLLRAHSHSHDPSPAGSGHVASSCSHDHSSHSHGSRSHGHSHASHAHDHSHGSHSCSDSTHSHSSHSTHSHSASCCGHGHSHSHSHDRASNATSSSSHDHASGAHTHSHDGAGCCYFGHGPRRTNKVIDAFFTLTGLRALANMMQTSRYTYPFAIAAFAGALAVPHLVAGKAGAMASAALAAAVYATAGLPSILNACHDISFLTFNTHVLTIAAAICLIPLGHTIEGALLLLLFNLSHQMEHILTVKAKGDMEALFSSIPTVASVIQLGKDNQPDFATEKQTSVEEISVGNLVVVRAGEELALDGVILVGEAMLSAEHITGESIPLHCKAGDEVPAGAVNTDGLLVIRVTATVQNSTPARMARLARDAQGNKPRIQTLVESVLDTYSKVVILGTVAVAVLLPVFAGVPFFGSPSVGPGSLYRAAGFLTTAAPCAIIMAPLVYVSAIAAAARRGILLKGASVIDALAACRVVALDKTGTLTTGMMACTSFQSIFPLSEPSGSYATVDELEVSTAEGLAIAVALSQGSRHPVAHAITSCFGKHRGLPSVVLHGFLSVPGRGVTSNCRVGDHKNQQVLFGSRDYVVARLKEIRCDHVAEEVEQRRAEPGEVVSFLVQEHANELHAVLEFRFRDSLHVKARPSVEALRTTLRTGQLAMLSGDNTYSVSWMAEMLGLRANEIHANLQPEDKLSHVQLLRSKHGPVLMVGDGTNDAAALAGADVGLAVAATPSTMAAAAADGVILSGKGAGIAALPFLLALAAYTRRVMLQNFAIAGLAILASALPTVAGWLPLWVGVTIHEGSTLLVAVNSLKPLFFRGPQIESAASEAVPQLHIHGSHHEHRHSHNAGAAIIASPASQAV